MKKVLIILSAVLAIACSTAVAGSSDQGAAAVGVIPFGYGDDNSRWISNKLEEFLTASIDRSDEFTLISSGDLNRAFRSIGFDTNQFRYGVPPEMIIEAGLAMEADLLVFGFVGAAGGDMYQVMWNLSVVNSGNTISPPPEMVQRNTDPVRNLANTIVSEINNQVGARAEEALNMARYHRSSTNWPSAITAYLQVLEVNANHTEALTELAAIYLRSEVDSLDRASEIFESLIAQDPANSKALSGMGTINLRQSNYETAREYFDSAIEADPDNTAAYSGLAQAYSEMGMTQEAISSFQAAIAANPGNLQARYALGLLFIEIENYTSAIPELEAVLATRPDYSNLRLMLANAYAETGQYASAVDNAKIVLEERPSDTDLALYVAQYEARAGRVSDAVTRLEGIISSTGNRQAYLVLATVYRDSGQRGSMQNVFNRLRNAYPGDPIANYMVGAFYYQSGSSKARVSELTMENVSTWESAIEELNAAISYLNQVTGYRATQAQNMVSAARNAISLCEEKIDRVTRYAE